MNIVTQSSNHQLSISDKEMKHYFLNASCIILKVVIWYLKYYTWLQWSSFCLRRWNNLLVYKHFFLSHKQSNFRYSLFRHFETTYFRQISTLWRKILSLQEPSTLCVMIHFRPIIFCSLRSLFCILLVHWYQTK